MRHRFATTLLAGALVLALGACSDLTSPNANFGDLDELQNNPTRSGLATAAQGLIIGFRDYHVDANDLVSMLGILGRESYNHDLADPRFESEMLGSALQPSSPAFGGNFWSQPYANIKLANILLTGTDQVEDAEIDAGEKEGLRGFAKTMQALDFLTVVNTRDESCGCPIQDTEDPREPAPQADRAQVFAHIAQLLDEAAAHLQAASGFPFRFSSGFDGFDTPAGFLEFNRGVRARVAVYRATLLGEQAEFQTALNALAQSFVDENASMELGVYHTFSTGSGDRTNDLFQPGADPNIRAHPSIEVDVETAGGVPDDRFTRKTREIVSRSYNGLLCTPQSQFPVCDVGFDIYNTATTPVPILRNEELLLLRAEANIGLGNLEAAEADINTVRAVSGGLPPVDLNSQEAAIDQVLYERRYSLLFEGGHRWIDVRRYERFDELPLDVPGSHVRNERFPLPVGETAARN